MREALARPASQLPAQEPADALAEGGLSPETARRLGGDCRTAGQSLEATESTTPAINHRRGVANSKREAAAARRPSPELPHNAFIHRWVATDDHIRRALLKLKPGKAADAGGWTAEAIWAVARLPRCRPLMAEWLTRMATTEQARPARLEMLRTHRLVALAKPGGGTRPILIAPYGPKSSATCSCARHGPPCSPIWSRSNLGWAPHRGAL